MFRGFFYQLIMKIAHKFNWHYAPPIYPEGDTQLWCKWCGFRQTVKRRNQSEKRGFSPIAAAHAAVDANEQFREITP